MLLALSFSVDLRSNGYFVAGANPRDLQVEVRGPGGRENAKLVGTSDGTLRLEVEREGRGGWRELWIESTSDGRFDDRYYLPASDTASRDEALRKRLVGRKIWVFGTREWTETFPDPQESLTVVDVRRRSPLLTTLAGPAFFIGTDWTSEPFHAWNPLVIELKLPRPRTPGEPFYDAAHPETAWLLVADPWQLWREASLVPPTGLLRRESKRVQDAFRRREVVTGMPRGLVRRLLGDPSLNVEESKTMRSRNWVWSGPAPDTYIVRFDLNGRVAFNGIDPDSPRRP